MKNKILYLILICISVYMSSMNAADYTSINNSMGFIGIQGYDTISNDESVKKEFKVQPGKMLDVGLEAGGTINIIGWNKDKVSAEFSFPRKDGDRYDISFNETESGIEIFADLKDDEHNRNTDVRLEVKVPENFNLDIETKGGKISIQNVNGELSGRTYGGNLVFSELSGSIDFKTYGGEIRLQKSKINGYLETMGGSIYLKDVEGDVSGKTMGGSVKYINVKGSGKDKLIDVSTMGGNIELDKVLSGSKVYTAGGSIEIGTAKNFVKAKTMGGNINIDEMDGGVEASTMSGEISVKIIEDGKYENRDVDLSSMNGNITLLIPAGYSFVLDAEIDDSDRYYEIESDFAVKQSIDDGSVHAETTLNGGKNKISVHTVNGNIYLKKI